MTLRGGPADKVGNLYEKLWTSNQLLRLLDGELTSIRLEDPLVNEAEFVVQRGRRREFHQAKHTHSRSSWSIASLNREGILQSMKKLLQDSSNGFVFISNCSASRLVDLCDSAKSAQSFKEFSKVFLKAKTRGDPFRQLCDIWQCGRETAFDYLRRTEVRTIDERDLQDQVWSYCRSLFLTNEVNVANELSSFIGDSVHATIQRDNLVEHMRKRGFVLRPAKNRHQAVRLVRQATDLFLNAARSRLILEELVPRKASESLRQRIDEPAIALVGKAGSGKTACSIAAIDELLESGCQVLAFRMDRYTSVDNTMELGRKLGFDDSPVQVLAAASEVTESKGVLVVDQLDALSTMSGRRSESLDLVEELLREAKTLGARLDLLVIVVCRSFDWDNDHSLRRLIPSDSPRVAMDEFADDEVKELLKKGGFEPSLFRNRQLQLLRTPQNLSLFLDSGLPSDPEPRFDSVTELFHQYWDTKRKLVMERTGVDYWDKVLELICSGMNASQELSVRRELLDSIPPTYLKQMASEGVLAQDGRRYGFGHESFFDYCFARLIYLQGSESLVDMLKANEQHLFRRGQVRQVLSYVRDADFDRYIVEVRNLLSNDSIRTHIKALVFALLAEVSGPTDCEWKTWQEWIQSEFEALSKGESSGKTISAIAWRYLFRSKTWFDFDASKSVVERMLASANGNLADLAINYLRFHQNHSPDEAASLLDPYVDAGGDWPRRLKWFVEWADFGESRRQFDLFLRLIDNGTLDEARGPVAINSTFWDLVRPIKEKHPEWVGEVVAHWIRRRATTLQSEGSVLRSEKLLGNDMGAAEIFSQAASSAPLGFVEHVLPAILEVSDTTIEGDSPPYRDAFWTHRIKTAHPNADEGLLNALEQAVETVGQTESAEECDEIESHLKVRESHVTNHLLLALYRGRKKHSAAKMVDTLCEQPWRFKCGYIDSPYWCAVEAIAEIVPYCTCEQRKKLEQAILGFLPEYERRAESRKFRGSAQFSLLTAIPKELRSEQAERHFQELERKLEQPPREPEPLDAHLVESPIGATASRKMSDEQWLKAVARYSGDDWRNVPDGITGGADELAYVLKSCVKEEPERFARLALKFDAVTNPRYMQYVLLGLGQVELESRLKIEVCRKAFDESRNTCGAEIADVIGSIPGPLSDNAVRMITWLATEHPDPSKEMWEIDAPGGGKYYGGEIYAYGINTVRGRAAIAIAKLMQSDLHVLDSFRCALDGMLGDKSSAVLSCVAGVLAVIAVANPAEAASLFCKMKTPNERLLATLHVCNLLKMLLSGSFHQVEPVVKKMICSGEKEVSEQGAILAGIAMLRGQGARHLVNTCMRSGAPQRLGIAKVASSNICSKKYREWCENYLIQLFEDDDSDVRREAASCFLKMQSEPLEEYESLIDSFSTSRAFDDDSWSIFYLLEESRQKLPGMTCRLCERYLERFSDEVYDMTNARARDPHLLMKLVFRTYQQHQENKWGIRALNLIDRLCFEDFFGTSEHFDQFER